MSVSLTPENKKTLRRLKKGGRWANESEIVRYGIHLVEVEEETRLKEQLELEERVKRSLEKAKRAKKRSHDRESHSPHSTQ